MFWFIIIFLCVQVVRVQYSNIYRISKDRKIEFMLYPVELIKTTMYF